MIKSYAMHKWIYAWGYDRLTEDEQRQFSRVVFELVVEAINACGKAPKDKLRLVPHVMANFMTISDARAESNGLTEGTLHELGRVGAFLTDIGRLGDGGDIERFVFNQVAEFWSRSILPRSRR